MVQQTIFGRVSQLVRANINDLINRAEDPEKMLDQLVLDFTNNISDATVAVSQTVGNLRLEEDDEREARESAAEWGRKAQAASHRADESGDAATTDRYNGLAKEALKKQIALEADADTLAAKIKADTEVVNNLKSGLTKMQSRLEELRSKRTELISRAKMAQAQAQVQTSIASVNAADPTSDLARFEDRIRQQEAQVRGAAELQSESLDEQFSSLEDDEADAEAATRLAALKAKTPVTA